MGGGDKIFVSVLQGKAAGLFRDLSIIDSAGQDPPILNIQSCKQFLHKSGTVQNTSRFSTPHFFISWCFALHKNWISASQSIQQN